MKTHHQVRAEIDAKCRAAGVPEYRGIILDDLFRAEAAADAILARRPASSTSPFKSPSPGPSSSAAASAPPPPQLQLQLRPSGPEPTGLARVCAAWADAYPPKPRPCPRRTP